MLWPLVPSVPIVVRSFARCRVRTAQARQACPASAKKTTRSVSCVPDPAAAKWTLPGDGAKAAVARTATARPAVVPRSAATATRWTAAAPAVFGCVVAVRPVGRGERNKEKVFCASLSPFHFRLSPAYCTRPGRAVNDMAGRRSRSRGGGRGLVAQVRRLRFYHISIGTIFRVKKQDPGEAWQIGQAIDGCPDSLNDVPNHPN